MGEYMFGLVRGKIDERVVKQADRIARKHDCDFVYANIPGSGLQGWFSGPNLGSPLDERMASAVNADLAAAGLLDDDGKLRR